MRLFKYCDAYGGVKILEEGRIKVSSPSEFNDPFDCFPWLDIESPKSKASFIANVRERSSVYKFISDPNCGNRKTRRIIRKEYVKNENRVLFCDHAKTQEIFQNSINKLRVLCLSENSSHPLMWAHYTKNHSGIVIEIETDGLFNIGNRSDGNFLGSIYKVDYTENRPCLQYGEITPPTLLDKGREWEYEHEWRVIYWNKYVKTRVINGVSMSFVDIPFANIVNVYIGCKSDDSIMPQLKQLLECPELRHIGLFRKIIHSKEFRLIDSPLKTSKINSIRLPK